MFGGGTGTTSLFGQSSTTPAFGSTVGTGLTGSTIGVGAHNPNKDVEVQGVDGDSISALTFSPPSLQQNFLVSGSWDNVIRCWEVSGAVGAWQTIPKAQQTHAGPVLDVRFSDVSFKGYFSYQFISLTFFPNDRTGLKFSLHPVTRL